MSESAANEPMVGPLLGTVRCCRFCCGLHKPNNSPMPGFRHKNASKDTKTPDTRHCLSLLWASRAQSYPENAGCPALFPFILENVGCPAMLALFPPLCKQISSRKRWVPGILPLVLVVISRKRWVPALCPFFWLSWTQCHPQNGGHPALLPFVLTIVVPMTSRKRRIPGAARLCFGHEGLITCQNAGYPTLFAIYFLYVLAIIGPARNKRRWDPSTRNNYNQICAVAASWLAAGLNVNMRRDLFFLANKHGGKSAS